MRYSVLVGSESIKTLVKADVLGLQASIRDSLRKTQFDKNGSIVGKDSMRFLKNKIPSQNYENPEQNNKIPDLKSVKSARKHNLNSTNRMNLDSKGNSPINKNKHKKNASNPIS